jgi:GNAT superfamily N-acetyltransferase
MSSADGAGHDPSLDQFVPAGLSDVERLVGWAAELYQQEGIPFDAGTVRQALAELIEDATLGRVWLLIVEGEPVGYVVVTFGYSIEYGGRDAFLDELFVNTDRRGRGLGTRALRFAADACRRLGIQALHLEVERANTSAQRVYRAAGFTDHDRYLMSLRLRP